MAMKPVVDLKIGDEVKLRVPLSNGIIKHWKYGAECASVGGGMNPGAVLTVAEKNTSMGRIWVVLQIPGRDPPGFLKVSGEELAQKFELA